MFLKNLIIVLRDIKRNSLITAIKALGLAVGMACTILILLFINDELSCDRYHADANRIFRMTTKRHLPEGDLNLVFTASDYGPRLVQECPEVTDAVRLIMHRDMVVEHGETRLTINPVYADPNILTVFSFPMIQGDRTTALNDLTSVVITRSLANRLFRDANALGQTVSIYDLDQSYDLKVTGILKDIPFNSHFHFEFLASLSHLKSRPSEQEDGSFSCYTYLRLRKKGNADILQKKLPDFLRRNFGDRATGRELFLQPLTSIHLGSHLLGELEENSRLSTTLFVSIIAVFILIIAGINFVNLSIARASRRSLEVGMRKVLGASKYQLIRQYLGESLIISFMALGFALIIVLTLLRPFSTLMNRHLTFSIGENPALLIRLLLLTLIVGVLSGGYPALFLSSYRPVVTLKGINTKSGRGNILRRGLIVTQFAVSIIFVIGTISIQKQLRFIMDKNLGTRNENVISVPVFKDDALKSKVGLLKQILGSIPGVIDITVSEGYTGNYNGFPIECTVEGKNTPIQMNRLPVGDEFFKFFGINILLGRDFRKDLSSDASSSVIINEKAAKILGWADPLGKQISSGFFSENRDKVVPMTVIGVVKDYHSGSLHDEIAPSVFQFLPEANNQVFLRLHPGNISETIKTLEKKWKELPTHIPFVYSFLDRPLETKSYAQDLRFGRVFRYSSAIALILAIIGVFGLMSCAVEERRREICIRKVLGSSRVRIVALMVKEFYILGIVANLIAWPIAFYIVHRWLNDFAYRTEIAWWIFVIAGSSVFGIGLLTVGFQAARVAGTHPSNTLRYE